MPKKISFFNDKKKIRKKYVIHGLIFLFLFTSCLSFCISYYYTDGNVSGKSSIQVPSFAPLVNNSINNNQNINLADTIINGKNLAPGAKGKFKIDINFTNVGVDAYYRISLDRTNVPYNMRFYTDEELTNEINDFEGIQLVNNSDKIAEHYVYWQWIYADDSNSNIGDSAYMGQDIYLPFTAYISQRIDNRTIIVNNIEKPTGRIALSGREGSFDIELDFSNVSLTNYIINFTKDDLSGDIHFYSDASYTNEITSVSGIRDIESEYETKTIYWKSNSYLSDNLYYVVSLY